MNGFSSAALPTGPMGARETTPSSSRILLLPLHVALMGLVIVALTAPVVSGSFEPATNHDAIVVATGLVLLGLVLYTRYALRFRWVSASLLYLVLLWIFHFGLAFTAIVAPVAIEDLPYWEVAWLYGPSARLAMLLAALGGAGFVLAVAPFAPVWQSHSRVVVADGSVEPLMHKVGWTLLVFGIAASMFILLRELSTDLFSVRYADLMAGVMQETRLPLAMDAAELGCLLAICGARRDRVLTPLVTWGAFGALLLVLGLRSEAVVPLAAFVIVLTHRGIAVPRSILVAAAIALVVILPVIRAVRTVGVGNRAEVSWVDVSPLAALTEFGSTLRAASVYIDWIADGEDLQWGGGYWAPIDRQVITRLMPGRAAVPLEDDPRIPSRNIETVGSIGLSATGEAYYNFGVFGPFLFYACVGALLGWLERRASASPYRAAALGVAMLVLYFNIRAAWLPVPARAGMALALLAACYLLARHRRAVFGHVAPSPVR